VPQIKMPRYGTNFQIWNLRCSLQNKTKNVISKYSCKVEAMQSRVVVVYLNQRKIGNCKIVGGLNVGCSIVLEPTGKERSDAKPVTDLRSRKVRSIFLGNIDATENVTCHGVGMNIE
jgi:hypothetical protein